MGGGWRISPHPGLGLWTLVAHRVPFGTWLKRAERVWERAVCVGTIPPWPLGARFRRPLPCPRVGGGGLLGRRRRGDGTSRADQYGRRVDHGRLDPVPPPPSPEGHLPKAVAYEGCGGAGDFWPTMTLALQGPTLWIA